MARRFTAPLRTPAMRSFITPRPNTWMTTLIMINGKLQAQS